MPALFTRGLGSGSLPTRGLASAATVAAPDLRQALGAYLAGLASISELVGDDVLEGRRPRLEALPNLVYTVVADTGGHWLSGSNGTSEARVRFDCWSYDLAEAFAIKKALFHALDGFRGDMGGLLIRRCRRALEADQHEWPEDASDRVLFRIVCDYRISYLTEIPTFTG